MILNMSGGGPSATLNFKVLGGTEAPSNPNENTIWVNTDAKITSWIFSPKEPTEPAEGMVWFISHTSSSVEFNALKKNFLQVYPNACYQWSGSAWVYKDAKTYKNGAWVDWFQYLYDSGNDFSDITGGYVQVSDSASGTSDGMTSMNEDSIYVYAVQHSNGKSRTFGRSTSKSIDLTNVSKIYTTGNCLSARNGIVGWAGVGIMVVSTQSVTASVAADTVVTSIGDFTLTLDVSALSGSYYIIPYAREVINSGYSNGCGAQGTFNKIFMQ